MKDEADLEIRRREAGKGFSVAVPFSSSVHSRFQRLRTTRALKYSGVSVIPNPPRPESQTQACGARAAKTLYPVTDLGEW